MEDVGTGEGAGLLLLEPELAVEPVLPPEQSLPLETELPLDVEPMTAEP
jgi:hypothetical protein